MCFSTEASFGAAIVLGGIGCITTKTSSTKNLYFLASIPFLFALQQFCEGLIWYNFSYQQLPREMFNSAVNLYLTFAFLIWPIWIPLSLYVAENISWRRSLILVNLLAGIGLSSLNLYSALTTPFSVQIMNHSVQYIGKVPEQLILYPLIVLLPSFLSSLKNMYQFGFLVLLAYIFASYFYLATFVSTWCFFSAVVSLVIYKILRDNQTDQANDVSKDSIKN